MAGGNVKPIRLALIGLNEHMLSTLLPAALGTGRFTVGTAHDPILGVPAWLHDRAAFTLDQALSPELVDAAIICATPAVHFAVGSVALDLGLPTFVEKPMAIDFPAAQSLVERSALNNTPLHVGLNLSMAPAFRHMLQSVNDRRPDSMVVDLRYSASKPRGSRWEGLDARRSLLLSHAVHAFDLVLNTVEEPLRIRSVNAVPRTRAEQLCFVLLEGASTTVSLTLQNNAGFFDLDMGLLLASGERWRTNVTDAVEFVDSTPPGPANRWVREWRGSKIGRSGQSAGFEQELLAFAVSCAGNVQGEDLLDKALEGMRLVDEVDHWFL